ncbi:hypothetical protein AVEN_185460-1 [Araneus ventricosus]|uniref:Uncharacterized protein n=1 Tax=Araneus ventricosus TaxID=182803 RepID=A0A4Y2VEG6_ARAVE|nr:hypothetical protein AVEN_185460-1 [Araneus ventricosus]
MEETPSSPEETFKSMADLQALCKGPLKSGKETCPSKETFVHKEISQVPEAAPGPRRAEPNRAPGPRTVPQLRIMNMVTNQRMEVFFMVARFRHLLLLISD